MSPVTGLSRLVSCIMVHVHVCMYKTIKLSSTTMVRCMFICSHLTVEESDSDSDEDLEGGVRHDLMMADEKVPEYSVISSLFR